jgi:hypothetical protein
MELYSQKALFLICIVSFIILVSNIGNIYSSSIQNSEQFEVYSKLSNLTKNTGNDVIESMRAIESGDNNIALNILANVTIKIEEIYNGLDILTGTSLK